jgi:hypothetical protein
MVQRLVPVSGALAADAQTAAVHVILSRRVYPTYAAIPATYINPVTNVLMRQCHQCATQSIIWKWCIKVPGRAKMHPVAYVVLLSAIKASCEGT